jgi:beta-lactam-binding protein with PASTA domain
VKLWWYKFTDQVSKLAIRAKKLLPSRSDTSEDRWFKIFVLGAVGLVVLMFLVGVLAFFLVLQGKEQTVVPDVRGRELTEALILLQEKELYPRLQLRFSSDPSEKGKILDQKPSAGTVVKAGKRITLLVSKGAVVDRVEDFRGKKLEEVRIHLQTLFTTYKPLLMIKEPVTYVFDSSPPGTILEQKPEPGTELSELTELVLVVSRGPGVEEKKVPKLVGMEYKTALEVLVNENIPFIFQLEPNSAGKRAGYVIQQTPPPGEKLEAGDPIELTMTEPPPPPKDTVFGLFDYTLPAYPVAVDLKVEAVSPGGERKVLLTMKHSGGRISMPFLQPVNTTLVLSIFDREIIRHQVQPTHR